jgi:hypothetical protein
MIASKKCQANYHRLCSSDRESLIKAGYNTEFIANAACDCGCHTEEA